MEEQSKWKSTIRDYITGKKVLKKDALLLMILTGILIFIIFLPTKNKNNTWNYYEEKKTTETEKSDMEKELELFLEDLEGIGKVHSLIYMSPETGENVGFSHDRQKITGVIITAQGAENNEKRMMIMQMVRTLYGLEYSQIEVFPMKRGESVISERGHE